MLETLVNYEPKGIEQKLCNELGTVYGTGSFEMYTDDSMLMKPFRVKKIPDGPYGFETIFLAPGEGVVKTYDNIFSRESSMFGELLGQSHKKKNLIDTFEF